MDEISNVKNIFTEFLSKDPLFQDKKVLQSNYTPDNIPHRSEQINQMAQILAPSLRFNKPSNLFVYGKTGTGKTLSVLHTTNKLAEMAIGQNVPLKIIYINCKLKKVADTEYRLMAQISREFGKAIPPTGLPTDEIYKAFFRALDGEEQLLILILDEIDQLVKKAGDEILYNLTRINSELQKSQVSIIGISNDLVFADNLDPRVKSSLSEEEIIFPPYNALQIQDILKERAKKAFKENILCQGVVEKCAAYAAREHGDARRALELLRVAGEVAERKGKKTVDIENIDEAEERIEKERIVDIVTAQPKQFQTTLYSLLFVYENEKSSNFVYTGESYEIYKKICSQVGLRPLTQRRFSDIIAELDMLGIINARVRSKGRYGRTREISIAVQPQLIPKIKDIIKKDLGLC